MNIRISKTPDEQMVSIVITSDKPIGFDDMEPALREWLDLTRIQINHADAQMEHYKNKSGAV